jgi:superfamily II DNA or RNA helicase
MILFSTNKSKTKLQIKCEDLDVFKNLREYFSIANTGASFARKKFRGRRIFIQDRKYAITPTGQCELGLYKEIEQYLIQKQLVGQVQYDENLKNLLNPGVESDIFTNFSKNLRDYQYEVVKTAIKTGWGTCVLGTGAGKTLTTAAIIENYFRNSNNKDTFKCLVIVPDLGLVSQTYEEFIESGISFTLTQWTGKKIPDLTSNVVICNMSILQSRFLSNDWVKYVDLLIVDEVHKMKPDNKVSKIISEIKTRHRYGFTGTLPEDVYDKWFIIGRLGPVLYEKNSSELRSQKYLTNVEVKVIELDYLVPVIEKKTDSAYRNELDYIYNNKVRNLLISKLCSRMNNNTLVLVNHIIHGEKLYEILKLELKKQVYFIRGEVDVEERDKIKQIMENHNDVVCVAISAIFSTGVNIKNIHNIMFTAGGKSFIRTVQSIGRGLRLHANKDQLVIYDICDNLKYSKQHSDKRKQIYEKEKINFTERIVKLG